MARLTYQQEKERRKMEEDETIRPSILTLFQDSMRKFASHRNRLKEARDAIVRLAAAARLRGAVALEFVAGKVWALPKTPKAGSRRCRAGTGPRSTR